MQTYNNYKSMATTKQIQLIHIAKSKLQLDDDIYRETLQAVCGVTSSKELSFNQAAFFIKHMQKAGFKINNKTKHKKAVVKAGGKIVTFPTEAQLALIDILKANIVWKYENGYNLWLEKRMKLKKILTSADAAKAIEGLKGILKINTKIISIHALPFPYQPDKNITQNRDGFVWMFDIKAKKLIRLSVNGEEQECLIAKT